jgi:hypothetical protein
LRPSSLTSSRSRTCCLHDMSMSLPIVNLKPSRLEDFEKLRFGISDYEDGETDAAIAEMWHHMAKLSLADD